MPKTVVLRSSSEILEVYTHMIAGLHMDPPEAAGNPQYEQAVGFIHGLGWVMGKRAANANVKAILRAVRRRLEDA